MNYIRGYCTHQKFGSFKIPVPLQNVIIRDFAKKNNFGFKLSTNEFYFDNCYMQLLRLIEICISEKIYGLVMLSYLMLPKDLQELNKILKKLLKNNIKVYFIIENLQIENKFQLKDFFNTFILKNEIKKINLKKLGF